MSYYHTLTRIAVASLLVLPLVTIAKTSKIKEMADLISGNEYAERYAFTVNSTNGCSYTENYFTAGSSYYVSLKLRESYQRKSTKKVIFTDANLMLGSQFPEIAGKVILHKTNKGKYTVTYKGGGEVDSQDFTVNLKKAQLSTDGQTVKAGSPVRFSVASGCLIKGKLVEDLPVF